MATKEGRTSAAAFFGMRIGLLLALFSPWQFASARFRDYTTEIYNWQTGPWGVCWSHKGCGQGEEERVVWCGDSLGNPVPSSLCSTEKKPLHSRPCYSACEGRWKTGQWSPCNLTPNRRVKQADGLCMGYRNRIVVCRSSLEDDANPRCPDAAPRRNITCYTSCPQDCVVGPWSSWTPCEFCKQKTLRTRQVIVAPEREGQPCPPISQTKECHMECQTTSTTPAPDQWMSELPSSLEPENRKPNPKLRVGEWGDCHLPTLYQPNINKPKNLNKSHRKRKHLKTQPEKETRLEVEFKDAFSFLQLNSKEGSEDQLPDYLTGSQLSKLSKINHHPQIGIQERNLSCIGYGGQEIDLDDCLRDVKEVVTTKRSCIVPVDCKVTEWTPWETSIEGCVAPNGQVVREVKIRKRTALTIQKGRGSPCPHLLERHTSPEPSLMPCSASFKWLASSWGPCLSTVGPEAEIEVACGGGVQKREIICVHTDSQVPVEEKYCVHVEPPPRYQRCEIGCERDCVVGPWSMWGMCTPEDCVTSPSPTTKGFRRRRREIVVSASSGGRDCPPLEEQTECLEPQCHKWIIGPWSECQLDGRSGNCGRGLFTRNVSCINSLGTPSPIESCRKELGSVPETEGCQVPCPYDCVLAEWSSWSPCSRPCSDKLSVGYTHRNTSILAPPGPGGNECPAPDELTQVKTCHEEPCAGAAWIAGEWGSCLPKMGRKCGNGVQRRPIYCIDLMKNQQTMDPKCFGLSKPYEERSCEVLCINECSLSAWSDWSKCQLPKQCPEDEDVITSVQKRWRKILVEPSATAPPCGQLEEERACAVSSGVCKPAKWVTTIWSKCFLAPEITCGTGFRVRGLHCINGSDEVTEPSECLLGNKIVPESSEECFVDCNTSCVTSSWTEWSSCPVKSLCSGANMKRTRKLLDGSENDPLCLNLKLKESQACPCQLYYSEPVSDWSECILGPVIDSLKPPSLENQLITAVEDDERAALQKASQERKYSLQSASENVCGVGNRYRSLRCLREDAILADPSSCGNKGMEWEPCMRECPSDCLVGPWGQWTPCNSTCGAGIQFRRREVAQRSLWNGRACPGTEQARACFGSCSTKWITEGWSDCILKGKEDCGIGSQERTVKCVETSPSGIDENTDNKMCDQRHKPANKRPCNVYCPGNCVVSEWSEWTICPPGCPENKDRMRLRQVVRIPSGNASSCQHLREEETCLTDVSCWKYSWTVGNWTSCVPLGHSSCGEGVKNRPISCIRSDGIYVDERFCIGETRPSPQEKWCYVDCPIDCHVTHWSEWDDSKCSCGENAGEMKRRRYVLVNPSESGRPCPKNLQETLPCPVTPCYTWERSPWSECDLQGGTCGHGFMSRHVKCIGPGGTVAPKDKCLSLVHIGGHTWPYLAHALDLNTQDGCYVPCEGDCELTEWSPWSHCHRDCYRGHKGGTQTRSRAVLSSGSSVPCPGPLWENKPCISGPCLTFSWQVIHGTPTCIRSDGLIVTGGCGDAPRPCVPECNVKGSVCSLVGVCVCKPGLRPQYSESNRYHLTRCFPSFNLSLSQSLPLSQAKYLPESINGWMFAMIGIGSVFVVFVAISVYLMCKSPRDQSAFTATQRRQVTLSYRNSAVST